MARLIWNLKATYAVCLLRRPFAWSLLLACVLLTGCGGGGGGNSGGSDTGTTKAAFQITDIGAQGGTQSAATAINNIGQVIGSSTAGAFLYSNGSFTNLTTQGVDVAKGINDAGQVVGSTNGNAVLWQNGTAQVLTGLPSEDFPGYSAVDINNRGQVLVSNHQLFLGTSGYILTNGTVQALGSVSLGFNGFVSGINDSGHVAGTSEGVPLESDGAFLYSNNAVTRIDPILSAGGESYAYAVNNSGQVVGSYLNSNGRQGSHAYLYDASGVKDLGTLGGPKSEARAINTQGQVVGTSDTPEDLATGVIGTTVFLFSGGKMVDLNMLIPANSGWRLTKAIGINDQGQICGTGTINGQTHAYLLTPSK